MKKQEIGFFDASMLAKAAANKNNSIVRVFDWDQAAQIIKEKLVEYPNLVAEAGLQGDWDYTGGVIFENGHPTNDGYTYLASNWAAPTLLLFNDDEEIDEIECYCIQGAASRFNSSSKWDTQSLHILGISLETKYQ